MYRTSVRILAVAVIALAPACASSGKVGETQSSSDFVTSVEIANTQATTAYDLVNRLRPNWLRGGGISSISGGNIASQTTLVYLDGNKIGELDALRSIPSNGIKTMRWLDPARAQTMLRGIGTEPLAGVIVLVSSGK
ncbi:MAG TPA: hypothetical protein VM099_06120 [Gemmatimonadaceae bacterium]|nr:hypothetical protein [Gemmatimonadaceae bacterium]